MILDLDIFNVMDKQTGYNNNPFASSSTFGEARDFWNPRTIQLAVRLRM